MRRSLWAAALALAGCGSPAPLPMAATPESSRAALVAALDGWKAGQSYQQLAAGSPPLLLRDDDLNRRAKLLDYSIEDGTKPNGTGYSYVVGLTLQDRAGASPPARRRVAYTVVTSPQTAISREDRAP